MFMKTLIKRLGIAIAVSLPGAAVADFPVSLHIDAPNSNGDIVWLSESGWGLNIKMVIKAEDMLGYATNPNWPSRSDTGFLVIEDPDGCPWMDDPEWRGSLAPAGCEPFTDPDTLEVTAEEDETYIEFRPDVDDSGVPDNTGDEEEQNALNEAFVSLDPFWVGSNGPEFTKADPGDGCVPDTDDPDCFQFGPPTGGTENDGWGYGSDDDLVGLFIYTEVGTGLLYDEPDFDQSVPRGVRNLAGMINSVTYDLSDITKTTSKESGEGGKPTVIEEEEARIWAHMNVPGQLVRNIIQYDACTGTPVFDPPEETLPNECSGDDLWRIDGGPAVVPPEKFGRADAASIWLLENSVFTVHAFLVSGHAPDSLVDVNGDGNYTDDAENAGFTVISNVDSIDLVQLSKNLCFGGGGSAMYFDLDANGEAVVPIVCPTSPGDIDRPPR